LKAPTLFTLIFVLAAALNCPRLTPRACAQARDPVKTPADGSTVRAGGRQEWEELRKRFDDPRLANLLAGGMWTLTHAYKSKQEVDKVLELLLVMGRSFEKQDPAVLDKVGGARGFKDRLAAYLKSDDDTVAGFAATMLAVSGDKGYVPSIALLLEKKDPPEEEGKFFHTITSRSRAAVALSLLDAREYVPRFVRMLRSGNRYDRSGAAIALGELRAKEHAKEVAALLTDEEFSFDDDDSPIYALSEMGVLAQHSDELAKVLRREFGTKTVEAAAYALASLGARRYAKDVARLLDDRFQRGDAAKALAVMGAVEYKGRIARLLDVREELDRADALLALGILNAKEYAPRIAGFLKDKGYVGHHAAQALVLMGEMRYARLCMPLVEGAYDSNLYFSAHDFHPLVEKQLERHRKRFAESYRRMKARLNR
jgi:HEAT repeat protein